MRALIAAARQTPSITPVFGARALQLELEEGRVIGVHAVIGGQVEYLPARAVILATGGIGQLFSHTTNPASACGDGLALAVLAGAELSDLEFVQFHPTALNIGRDPMPLLTEALRGEGAMLINEKAEHYMQAEHAQAELAPRDIVARATWRQLQSGHKPLLDCRAIAGPGFAGKFSLITEVCKSAGLDPAKDPLPVAPAAHYHMGGVKIDDHGRSSVAGLWACGEVACSYIHGANRLASNSLLEALVYGEIVAKDVGTALSAPAKTAKANVKEIEDKGKEDNASISAMRKQMYAGLGLVRDRAGMQKTLKEISTLAAQPNSHSMPARLLVAAMMCVNALEREESRGAHFRSDFPDTAAKAAHSGMTLGHLLDVVPDLQIVNRER
jgi:L-aspartate oxidase